MSTQKDPLDATAASKTGWQRRQWEARRRSTVSRCGRPCERAGPRGRPRRRPQPAGAQKIQGSGLRERPRLRDDLLERESLSSTCLFCTKVGSSWSKSGFKIFAGGAG